MSPQLQLTPFLVVWSIVLLSLSRSARKRPETKPWGWRLAVLCSMAIAAVMFAIASDAWSLLWSALVACYCVAFLCFLADLKASRPASARSSEHHMKRSRRSRFTASRTFAFAIIAAAVLIASNSALACKGELEAPAVARVQSSWGPAEVAMQSGDYQGALRRVRSTLKYLPLIGDRKIRKCVAEGAYSRIAEATAASAFLKKHPGDRAGAAAAVRRTAQAYPFTGNCP